MDEVGKRLELFLKVASVNDSWGTIENNMILFVFELLSELQLVDILLLLKRTFNLIYFLV